MAAAWFLNPRPIVAFLGACALAASAGACGSAGGGGPQATTPATSTDRTTTATRNALGSEPDPAGADHETLGLSRVVIPPGAQLPLHYHPGTQVAYIDKGVLTYGIEKGHVDVMRGAADGKPTRVRRIAAGQTATISAGEWIVERRDVIHRAANRGKTEVVVLLSTLLRDGAPAAVPVAQAR